MAVKKTVKKAKSKVADKAKPKTAGKANSCKTKTSSDKKCLSGCAASAAKKTRKISLTPENVQKYISERAYYIWEEWGCPDGAHEASWAQAEKEFHDKFAV
ncbi:MAG: DUF2934 domain-containing protein [Candidatus Omnitrophica bacterium]|nr:DUF2934 domain-containing protein [Candidatus Omnitrophota bacterium]MDD5081011.1 DUF2934 domain-containing protein [Candidatus Omnitrophota bacterium]